MASKPITQAVKDVLEKQIKVQDEVKGNLVEVKGNYDRLIFLIFDDGRYAIFEAASTYDDPPEIELVEGTVEYYELARVGLLSQKDSNIENEKQNERMNQQQRDRERSEYMRLKEKYEKKGGV